MPAEERAFIDRVMAGPPDEFMEKYHAVMDCEGRVQVMDKEDAENGSLLPPVAELEVKLAANAREQRILRALLKIARKAEAERLEDEQVFGRLLPGEQLKEESKAKG